MFKQKFSPVLLIIIIIVTLSACGSKQSPKTALQVPTNDSFIKTGQVLEGHASWYGGFFHGRRTANGEIFNKNELTAAHKTLPFGTILKVTNPETEKSINVRVNDRGPYVSGRILDLSQAAAQKLGYMLKGTTTLIAEVVVPKELAPASIDISQIRKMPRYVRR